MGPASPSRCPAPRHGTQGGAAPGPVPSPGPARHPRHHPLSARLTAKAVAVLLPILGTSWVFGVLAVNNQAVAFQYAFAILNSLQVGAQGPPGPCREQPTASPPPLPGGARLGIPCP